MIPSYLSSERGDLERLSRQHCHAVRLNERFVICRVLGKYILYADPEDVGLTPHLCLDGFWESWVTIAMARLLQPGWHCVDVGANHGYYTMIMADAVEPSGRVIAERYSNMFSSVGPTLARTEAAPCSDRRRKCV